MRMANNSNGYIAASTPTEYLTSKVIMERFDALCPEIRAILRDAHHNVNIKPGHERLFPQGRHLTETLRRITVESALKTYGTTYPLETVK